MESALDYNQKMSSEAYLAWEEQQLEKHEYYLGEVFAMSGAKQSHVLATGNWLVALKLRLRGRPCRVYASDLKLQLLQGHAYFYPDVMVSCSAHDHRVETAITEPILVVEILSQSTAAYDRSGKFAAYRTVASLQEYLLVDTDKGTVECYHRAESGNGDWLYHCYRWGEDERVPLKSLDLVLPLAEVFEDLLGER